MSPYTVSKMRLTRSR